MCTGRGSNQGPLGPKSDALTTAPLCHLRTNLRVLCQNDANGIANSEDLDQEQSDLGLHCLPRPICPKT